MLCIFCLIIPYFNRCSTNSQTQKRTMMIVSWYLLPAISYRRNEWKMTLCVTRCSFCKGIALYMYKRKSWHVRAWCAVPPIDGTAPLDVQSCPKQLSVNLLLRYRHDPLSGFISQTYICYPTSRDLSNNVFCFVLRQSKKKKILCSMQWWGRSGFEDNLLISILKKNDYI